nr:reverse transcriptase domain-containing protein [Tanacetum cinerariifolium]
MPESDSEALEAAPQSLDQAPLSPAHAPEYPEYLAPSDDDLEPAKIQPLPASVSPTVLLPRARFAAPYHRFEIRESLAAVTARQPGSALARDSCSVLEAGRMLEIPSVMMGWRTLSVVVRLESENGTKEKWQAKNKRRMDNNSRNNHAQQSPYKRQDVARAYAVEPGEKREYAGTLPLCNKCKFHHNRPCAAKCANYKRIGHLARDCSSPTTNKNDGNTKWNGKARRRAYALGGGEPNLDSNVVTELGSFDAIIGMAWLSMYRTMIVCDEKIVRIPYGDEVFIVKGDKSDGRNEFRLNIISCTKTQKYFIKGCRVFLARITEKKTEDKSEEKRPKDVLVIRDFLEVFPEDLPGVPLMRRVDDYDCEIRYHPGKANVVADALSRKEWIKPLRVRALVMAIGLNLLVKILNAHVEARKAENINTKDLGGKLKTKGEWITTQETTMLNNRLTRGRMWLGLMLLSLVKRESMLELCPCATSASFTMIGRALQIQKMCTCFECEIQGPYKYDFLKLKNKNDGNTTWNGKARRRAYALGGGEPNLDSNVVTELGSFDAIIGMDWLSMYRTMIVCDEKIVRIPYGDEVLIVKGDKSDGRNEFRLNIISCTKTQKYFKKGCHVFLARITKKKTEDKSEEKRPKDVLVIEDFLEVFPEDLPGVPLMRRVEF